MRELRKKEKGISEVIGTILILAITVVLFSSIFYYVAVMPPPQSQIYSSFVSNYQINSNGTFNITITNYGGESLPVNSTEFLVAVQNPLGHATHLLSYSKIYNQIKNGYFRVGSSFTYYSYWDGLSATYLSSIAIYLISTQNNQVVYSNILQGSMSNVYVMGFSYSPDPFPANITFIGHITSFVIYNMNYKILPVVKISIPAYNIKNQNMTYISPMQFGFSQSMSAVYAGIYKVYINATLGTSYFNYTGLIQVVNSQSPIALKITSISLQNPEPVHGSNTTVFISIYNPSNKTEKFRLNITDIFPSYPNKWDYIYTTPSSQNDPTSYFTIGPMTTIPITVPWYKIGGSYVAAGTHQLSVSFLNVTPYIANIGNSINVTVYPKIIFVGDAFSLGSSSNVYNDYYWLFKYLNFPITITPPTPSPSIFVNVSGYDFVIWVMGSSSATLGPNQQELISILNEGGSLLLIGNSTTTFSGFGFISSVQQPPKNNNVTIKYQNLTKLSPNSFQEIINYKANITVPPNLQYVTFNDGNGLANFSGNPNPSAIYGVSGPNYGKYVFIGYQFSRMFLYQQYYIMNKIVMWLSNISISNGVQDIALVDMNISNPNPMFMQPVNFTFYIQNFSPGPFGPTYLEFEINGQTVPVVQGNATIPSNNIYVPPIPGYGDIMPISITWYADIVPGTYQIFAYVNPYHDPTEINYNNNILSSLININFNVKFSILVVHAHLSSSKNNISAVTNVLNNTVGVGNYKFFNYIESTGSSPPSAIPVNLSSMFKNYNLVIIDVNNSGVFDSNLIYAIKNYINNPNSYKYPYSLIILGENAGYSISSNTQLQNILNISYIKTYTINKPNSQGSLFGLVYNGVNINAGALGQNLSRGYGLLYDYSHYSTVISLKSQVYGTAIFDVNNYAPFNSVNMTGNAVIENLSNVIVTIFPYNFENIAGFIQNHTNEYSPKSTSSNPLSYYPPSASKYAKNFLMLNLLVASRYMFNKPLPEILSCDVSINSPVVTLNNYYLYTITMRNLGAVPAYVTLEAFEEASMYYSSQPIYLVGSTMNSITTVTATVIWKPSYASSPTPEWLRFVLIPSSSSGIPFSPMQEALISKSVYYFYNNGSSLSGWNHYNVIAYITGENLFGLSNPNTSIYTTWNGTGGIGEPGINISYGIRNYTYFSYPNSWWIQDIINPGSQLGGFSYVYFRLPTVQVVQNSIVTLSWYWKYSIAEAQNGIFLMVEVSTSGSKQWYQVYLPYNSNPDLGNIVSVHDPNNPTLKAKIYQAFNGVSGGGTFSWEYYSINTNALYVMNNTTGLPMNTPLNIANNTKITFFFYYISPDYYASYLRGSSTPGNGTYIDNVLLSITSGGNDGWRVIIPNQKSTYYGIANDGLNYLGFSGAPTQSLIADYNNNSGYPSFEDSLWDNLITPPIDLVNALTASLNFTFKANIAQGLYGYGWPPDEFVLSISNNNGASWTQLYSPATYPTNPILPNVNNNGQSGGGTVYYTGSGCSPANNANSTYWLTVSISLNFFVGQNILLDFQIITNNGWPGWIMINHEWKNGSILFLPWHAVGYNDPKSNPFLGFYMTNIYIQGYSIFTPIQVQFLWT